MAQRGRPAIRYYERIRSDTSKNRFVMRMVSLESTLRGQVTKTLMGMDKDTAAGRAAGRGRMTLAMRAFATGAVVPTLKAFAPVREGAGGRALHGRRKLLRDTIEAAVTSRVQGGPSMEVKMGAWGEMTTDGRRRLPSRGRDGVYKLILPGGTVIYRRNVGAATTRAFSTGEVASWEGQPSKPNNEEFPPLDAAAAKERMEWSLRAWRKLKQSGQVEELATELVEALLDGGEYRPTPEAWEGVDPESSFTKKRGRPARDESVEKGKSAAKQKGGGGEPGGRARSNQERQALTTGERIKAVGHQISTLTLERNRINFDRNIPFRERLDKVAELDDRITKLQNELTVLQRRQAQGL